MPDSFNFASPPFDQLRPINARPSSRLSASATMRRGNLAGGRLGGPRAVRPAQGRGRGARRRRAGIRHTPRTTCSTSAGCSPAAASTATWRSRKASSTSCRPVASTSCAGRTRVRPLLPGRPGGQAPVGPARRAEPCRVHPTRIAREHLLPALEVEASLSLGDAARLQLSHGADALLVRLERDGSELGIVTRTDLMSAHFRDGRSEWRRSGRWPMVRWPASNWAISCSTR